MAKKYTIAVMGDSGVGKTVFFVSYFYQVIRIGVGALNDGKKHYSIAIESQEVDDKINELMSLLFTGGIIGTSVAMDFSFVVRDQDLNMDIELFDVPGGWTPDRKAWDTEGIREKLQNAKGALFFISGEDLVKKREDAERVFSAFQYAIEVIRTNTEGDLKGRADVPIWFIITKGDTIPDETLESLKEKIQGLLGPAGANQQDVMWFVKNVFEKGKNVEVYKTSAMGKWHDENTPPSREEFKPVNLVEPMEDLFVRMAKSQIIYAKKRFKVFAFALFIVATAAFCFAYWLDSNHWKNVLQDVQRAKERDNYVQAIAILDSYQPPLLSSWLVPSFLRSEGWLKAARDDVYNVYEAARYAPIASATRNVDVSVLPTGDDMFRDTANKVDEYLADTHFAEINPNHYEQVSKISGYFHVGRFLTYDPNKDEASPDEVFSFIIQCLNYDAPESWQEQINTHVTLLFRYWVTTLPKDAGIVDYENYIGKLEQLEGYPQLPPTLLADINKNRESWKENREDLIVKEEHGELLNFNAAKNSLTPDEELNLVIRSLNRDVPERWRGRIEQAIDVVLRHWCGTLRSDADTKDYDDYIDMAAQMAAHSRMPANLVSYLQERRASWKTEKDERGHQIGSGWINEAYSMSPEDGVTLLEDHMSERISPAVREKLREALESLYDRIADNASQEYANDIDGLRETIQKFPRMTSRAKEKLQARINFLNAQHRSELIAAIRSAETIKELEEVVKSLEEQISDQEIRTSINNTLKVLFDERIRDLRDEMGSAIIEGKFSETKDLISSACSSLKREIQNVVDESTSRTYAELINSERRMLLDKLRSGHYDYCKDDFQVRSYRSSRKDIAECLSELGKFISMWPDSLQSGEGAEVIRASQFLSAIQGGVRGRLTVVEGDFSAEAGWVRNPSIYVNVEEGKRNILKTEEVTGNTHPSFNASCEIIWTVESPGYTFKAINTNWRDKEVFERSISVYGFKGYINLLSNNLRSGKNSLRIRFEPYSTIPDSPW